MTTVEYYLPFQRWADEQFGHRSDNPDSGSTCQTVDLREVTPVACPTCGHVEAKETAGV